MSRIDRGRGRRLLAGPAGVTAAFALGLAAVAAWSPTAGAADPPEGGGAAMIRSWPTGLCVDSTQAEAQSQTAVAAFSHACDFSTRQVWQEAPSLRLSGVDTALVPFANEYRLVDLKTQRCLDSNAAGDVYTLPCAQQNDYQSWIRVIPALPPDKVPADDSLWPVIYEDFATNRCLSIGGETIGGGPALRTVPCGKDLPDVAWTDDMFFRRGY